MRLADIIQQVQADGVTLALTPDGTVKARGKESAVRRWLPVIRAHKAELLDELRRTQEEREILDWLTRIGEDDPVIWGETLDKCRGTPDALRFFLALARGEDMGAVQ